MDLQGEATFVYVANPKAPTRWVPDKPFGLSRANFHILQPVS